MVWLTRPSTLVVVITGSKLAGTYSTSATASHARVLCTLSGLRACSVLPQRGHRWPMAGFGARSTSEQTSQPIRPMSTAIGTRAFIAAPPTPHPTAPAGQRHGWR